MFYIYDFFFSFTSKVVFPSSFLLFKLIKFNDVFKILLLEKICSVGFVESASSGHEYWGSALAAAVLLKFWGLGQMSVKLSLVLQWISVDVGQSREDPAGSGWRLALQILLCL